MLFKADNLINLFVREFILLLKEGTHFWKSIDQTSFRYWWWIKFFLMRTLCAFKKPLKVHVFWIDFGYRHRQTPAKFIDLSEVSILRRFLGFCDFPDPTLRTRNPRIRGFDSFTFGLFWGFSDDVNDVELPGLSSFALDWGLWKI